MSRIDDIKKIYFIGIGGIGMSALARYFLSRGVAVSGYDRTSTPLTRELEAAGIEVHYEENIDIIPKDTDVVVYTPAIPAAHAELVYYREHSYPVVKRSDILQWITESSFNVCIGGTHGKTTVTSMTAHVLRHSGYGCNAFLGGIAANYNTNFWSSRYLWYAGGSGERICSIFAESKTGRLPGYKIWPEQGSRI
jgi:UDP-N-acetylmuramate--alanine ligase